MEKKQFSRLMETLIENIEERRKFENAIKTFFDSNLICHMGEKLCAETINYLEKTLNCKDIISWYLYDLDCGKKPLHFELDGQKYLCDSLDKLWLLINWNGENLQPNQTTKEAVLDALDGNTSKAESAEALMKDIGGE